MGRLRSVRLNPPPEHLAGGFPFTVPALRSALGATLDFSKPVTFFVGENGSGKSTLLEGLACAIGSIAVGSDDLERDSSLAAVRPFAKTLSLAWERKSRKGFFMRSEDFFGYAKKLRAMREEHERELRAIDGDPALSPTARAFGRMPFATTIGALDRSYGPGLDAVSHGESFLALFQARFTPGGLYLLDEPEAPLSPVRQLGLLAMLRSMTEEHAAQFIIATHSPILLAFPGAAIYGFEQGALRPVAYDDVEHVRLTREFLANPQQFLRHL